MKLVAKKPCSFGGRNFYIDEEIPPGLVTDAALQERMGVLAVVTDAPAELTADGSVSDGVVVSVVRDEDGDHAEMMGVPLTVTEVQEVFAIMQMVVQDAEKAISEVTGENVLIVLHACDSRSGIKKAALKRAGILFPDQEGISGGQDSGTAGDGKEAGPRPAG